MKIKLDENVTTGVVQVLMKLGHDVQTTIEEGLTGKPDSEIWSLRNPKTDFSSRRIWISLIPGNSHRGRTGGFRCCAFIHQIKLKLSRASLSFFRARILNRGEAVSLWRRNTRCECAGGNLNI